MARRGRGVAGVEDQDTRRLVRVVVVVAASAGLAGLCFLVGLVWALPQVGVAGPPQTPRAAVVPPGQAGGAVPCDPSVPEAGPGPGGCERGTPEPAPRF